MTMTLDDVRNLEPDEVTPIDIQVLKENKDQLTEDENLRFASFLEEKIETPEPIADPPAAVVPDPEPIVTPEPEKITLTKEEISSLVAEEIKKLSPAPVNVPTKEEIEPFIPEDWEPKGWGEVFEKVTEFAKVKEARMTAAAQKELDTINDTLTSQIDVLRDAGEPIPAKGTKEYKEFDDSLTKVALEYQIPTFTSAYQVWKKINSSAPASAIVPEPVVVKPVNADNKAVAAKIGGAKIENGSPDTTPKYKDIRGKSPRQVADSFLEELE